MVTAMSPVIPLDPGTVHDMHAIARWLSSITSDQRSMLIVGKNVSWQRLTGVSNDGLLTIVVMQILIRKTVAFSILDY